MSMSLDSFRRKFWKTIEEKTRGKCKRCGRPLYTYESRRRGFGVTCGHKGGGMTEFTRVEAQGQMRLFELG